MVANGIIFKISFVCNCIFDSDWKGPSLDILESVSFMKIPSYMKINGFNWLKERFSFETSHHFIARHFIYSIWFCRLTWLKFHAMLYYINFPILPKTVSILSIVDWVDGRNRWLFFSEEPESWFFVYILNFFAVFSGDLPIILRSETLLSRFSIKAQQQL